MIYYPDDVQKVKGTLEGGDDVYEGVPAKEQLNIFYPPQVSYVLTRWTFDTSNLAAVT